MLPAAAIAASSDVDPIFAAIERHREAWRAFSAACDLTDSVLAEEQGREVTKADKAAYEAYNAEQEALAALFATPPITLPACVRRSNGWSSMTTAAFRKRRAPSSRRCSTHRCLRKEAPMCEIIQLPRSPRPAEGRSLSTSAHEDKSQYERYLRATDQRPTLNQAAPKTSRSNPRLSRPNPAPARVNPDSLPCYARCRAWPASFAQASRRI
jgi:hypothetical protein